MKNVFSAASPSPHKLIAAVEEEVFSVVEEDEALTSKAGIGAFDEDNEDDDRLTSIDQKILENSESEVEAGTSNAGPLSSSPNRYACHAKWRNIFIIDW